MLLYAREEMLSIFAYQSFPPLPNKIYFKNGLPCVLLFICGFLFTCLSEDVYKQKFPERDVKFTRSDSLFCEYGLKSVL